MRQSHGHPPQKWPTTPWACASRHSHPWGPLTPFSSLNVGQVTRFSSVVQSWTCFVPGGVRYCGLSPGDTIQNASCVSEGLALCVRVSERVCKRGARASQTHREVSLPTNTVLHTGETARLHSHWKDPSCSAFKKKVAACGGTNKRHHSFM